jgi:hypothetical protein
VVDERCAPLGLVVEERAWLGHTYGPPTFSVVHNPSGGNVPARWRSDGHPTPMVALSALVDHLEQQ